MPVDPPDVGALGPGWAEDLNAILVQLDAGKAENPTPGTVRTALVTDGPAQTITKDVYFASGRPWVDITSKGAVGNNSEASASTNRVAINAAFAAAKALGDANGNSIADVYVPPGVFYIDLDPATGTSESDPKRALTALSRLRVYGPGTIKLKSGVGNYAGIISSPTGTAVDDFTLNVAVIDCNGSGNPLASSADMDGSTRQEWRAAFGSWNGSRVRIQGVRFVDVGDCINLIVLNGDGRGGCNDCVVDDNAFEGVGLSTFVHDTSLIYWVGHRLSVQGNRFVARSPGLYGCTGAIEMHGTRFTVRNNYIENFYVSVYATGVSAFGCDDSEVSNNKMVGTALGVQILAMTFTGFTGTHAIRSLKVHDNSIEVDRDQWYPRASFLIQGIQGYAAGIARNSGSTLPTRNVSIKNNTIRFLATAQPGTGSHLVNCGITWYAATTTFADEDLDITGNTIYDAHSSGIMLNARVVRAIVANNTSINPGGLTNVSTTFWAGVYIGGPAADCSDVSVLANKTIDTRTPKRVTSGVYFQMSSVTSFTNLEALDNTLRCYDGTATRPFLVSGGAAGKAPFIRVRTRDAIYNAAPVDFCAFGSYVVDETSGKRWRQDTAPSGTGWVAA